jgi:UDP-glucose 4-epimerase
MALVMTTSGNACGKFLVTGASGFIGRRLVQVLRSQGHAVTTLTRPQHDLLQPESLVALLEGIDTVFHLAAYAHINQINKNQLYATNVAGTANLLDAAIAAGVRHLIYVSSVLADPAFDQPRTPYGDSKYQAEQRLMAAHARGDIQVTIVRPVNVYGPGMKGNLMTLLRFISKGWMPPLPAFTQGFSLIGVDDLCQALMLIALSSDSQSHSQSQKQKDENQTLKASQLHSAKIYTVCDGQVYDIKTLESAMHKALGRGNRSAITQGWTTPRPVFYLGALGLEVVSRVFRLKNAPGLRSWYALSGNRQAGDNAIWVDLGYSPRDTFYSTLPAIIEDAGLAASQIRVEN